MSLCKWLSCASLFLLCVGLASAEPESPLDLVRGLRAAGLSELALEYLQEIESKSLSEDDRKVLPLERARCLLEVADDQPDEGTRTSMVGEAKEAFNDFILKYPNHPRVVDASLSLARLSALEAKAQLHRARRMELPPRDDPGYDAALTKKRQEAEKARPLFLVASKNFEAAAKQLKTQLENPALSPADRKALEQDAIDAELASAVNQYNLAETYLSADATLQLERGKYLEEARRKFGVMTSSSPNNRTYWIAQAWKGEVLMELSRAAEAEATFKDILDSRLPEAEAGKQLARFFQLRRAYETAISSPTTAKLQPVEKELRAWLAKFGGSQKVTPEVYSAKYYLAVVLQKQAEITLGPLTKDPNRTIGATTRKQLDEAERLYRDLSQSDNDYTQRANRNRMEIVRRLIGEGEKEPSEYATFEAAQLAALIQMAKLADAENALAVARQDPDAQAMGFWAAWASKTRGLQYEISQRRQRVLSLLDRARHLATEKDSPADVTDNLLRLVYFYQITDQPHQAAVLGEYIARNSRGAGGKAALAGFMAINGYSSASSGIKFDVSDPAMASLADAARRVDRQRAIEIARYLDERYPNDAPTDAARHRLAQLLLEEDKLDQAFLAITKVRPGYTQIANARQLQGYIASRLLASPAKDLPLPPGGREAVFRRTIGDLERVSKPPPTALQDEVASYLGIRVRLAQLYLLQSKVDPDTERTAPGYDRALRVADEMLALIPTFDSLTDKEAKGKKLNLRGMELNFLGLDVRTRALFLRGMAKIEAKQFEEAAAAIEPALEDIKKSGALVSSQLKAWASGQGDANDDEATLAYKARIAGLASGIDKTRREIVLAAFKLRLAQGQVTEATKMLDLLEQAGGSIEANQPILEMMARELSARIPALSQEGKTNPTKAKEAEDLKAGLAILVKRLGTVPNLPPASIIFLGETLLTVEEYEDALKEFAKIPPPSRADWATVDPATLADVTERNKLQNEIRYYTAAQLATVRALRLLKRIPEAEALIASIIGTPEKKGWGSARIDARKELALVHEAKASTLTDNKLAGAEWKKALDQWTLLFRFAEKRVRELPADTTAEQARKVKSAYFDSYFEIQRVMIDANSQLLRGKPGLAATFTDVAKKIVDMETANKIPQLEQEGKGILSAEVWNRYCDLIEKHPELKTAYTTHGGKFFLERPKQ
jgi:tetratricopeptide (TPR) repeat protein